ncbi:MAG: hypothetical protein AB1567_02400 [bacterium]
MFVQPILPSEARTTSGESQIIPIDYYTNAQVFLDITAASGTSPTLDVTIEYSPDGSRWFTHTSFSQKTTTGKDTLRISSLGAYMRIKYTIAGTTPSFTFSVDIVFGR